jgi:glutaredoxin 2
MSNKKSKFSFGNVGGRVNIKNSEKNNQAGADIVARDKITITDHSTHYHGFKKEQDKEQFLSEIKNLRTLLRSIKGEIEGSDQLDQPERDEMSLNLIQQIKALKAVKKETANLLAGQEASSEQTLSITDCFEKTNELMDKAHAFGEKVAELSIKITPVVMTLKSLFGL